MDQRSIDDPELLAQQARETAEKQAADLRAAPLPIEVEPQTIYRP